MKEGLPSAQCMALLETNVELRRNINLYNLFGGETQACWCVRLSNILQFKKKKSLLVRSEQQVILSSGGWKSKSITLQKTFSFLGGEGDSSAPFSSFLTNDSRVRRLDYSTRCILMPLVRTFVMLEQFLGPKQTLPLCSDPPSLQIQHSYQT